MVRLGEAAESCRRLPLGEMRDLTARPLACVALALALGIALAGRVGCGGAWALAVAMTVAGAAAGLARKRPSVLAGALALGVGVAAGGALWHLSGVRPETDVSRLPEGGQTVVGMVAGPPRYSDGVWRFVLEAEAHDAGKHRDGLTGPLYVRLRSPEPVERGQRWRLTGRLHAPREATNPGQRSEAARLASLGVSAVLNVGGEELAESLGPGEMGAVASHAYAAQARALRLLEHYVSRPYRELTAAVAASVIFGVHAAPPPRAVTEVFRRAGTIHLLVVSGAIVSMVFAMVFFPGALGAMWRRARAERQMDMPVSGRGRVAIRPGPLAAVAAILVVTYYAMLTEGGQAVVRAAVMGVFAGVGIGLRRIPKVAREHGLNPDHYTLLAAAALVILAAHPEALFQPGFQLSFAAVWAILYLTPKAMWLVSWLPKWLGYTVVGTIAAQLATFPILAYHYGQAPIAGFGANLLAIPLAGIVLVSGMLTCGLGVVLPWLAPLAGWVCGVSTRWMVWVSSAFAALPGASFEIARPGIGLIVSWYVGLVALGQGMGALRARREEVHGS